MAQADWTELSGGLNSSQVKHGVSLGSSKPSGGGNFTYGFSSQEVTDGVVALTNNQVNFAPMAAGGSIRGAIKRGPSAGKSGFAPFFFIGLQGTSVTDLAYILGLSDGDPNHIELRKGALSAGLPDAGAQPAVSPNILMRSTDAFEADVWHHLRLDMLVQGTGDVVLKVFRNDLDAHSVVSPVWELVPGMEGPNYPTFEGFVDDSLGVITGTAPFASGRAGYGMQSKDVGRRGFFDQIQVLRTL